jgi:hypothetical protein
MTFGSGYPATFTGLKPTFLIFYDYTTGATIQPPVGITEAPQGWGIYYFQYGATHPISFVADAATTSPGAIGRYVRGQIDPADRTDEYGNTSLAYSVSILAAFSGTSFFVNIAGLGSTLSSIGGISGDPGDLFGYVKRMCELFQGQQQFNKSTGSYLLYDRTGATLIKSSVVTNSATLVQRT